MLPSSKVAEVMSVSEFVRLTGAVDVICEKKGIRFDVLRTHRSPGELAVQVFPEGSRLFGTSNIFWVILRKNDFCLGQYASPSSEVVEVAHG